MQKAKQGDTVIYYADGNPNGVGLTATCVGVSKFSEHGPIDVYIYPTPGSQSLRPIRQVRHFDDPFLDDHPEDRVINGDYGGVWDSTESHEQRRLEMLAQKKRSSERRESERRESDEIQRRRKEEELIASEVTTLYAEGRLPSEIAARLRKPVELIQRVLIQYSSEYQKARRPQKAATQATVEIDKDHESMIREVADQGFTQEQILRKLRSKGVKKAEIEAFFDVSTESKVEEKDDEPDDNVDPWADAPARAAGTAPNAIPSGVQTLAGSHGNVSDSLS